MANYTHPISIYANNFTMITGLSGCDSTKNLSKTIEDLFDYYRSNRTNPVFNLFSNVNITDVDCTSTEKYFNQIVTLTKRASIQIQIQFASIYYEFIQVNSYVFNGLHVNSELSQSFNLSSITLNNTAQSDACSSASIARESLCALNSTTPVCTITSANSWNFNCSAYPSTSTISSTNKTNLFRPTAESFLEPWQIGLISGISFLFVLMILILIVCYLRRHFRSKRMTFSNENLFDDVKITKKNGIPRGQAFKNTPTIIQPIQNTTPKTPWINTNVRHQTNQSSRKPPSMPTNRGTVKDHMKIHPTVTSNIPKKTIYIPNNHSTNIVPKVYQSTAISRPVSGTSTNRLRLITNGLEESVFDNSDDISLDPSNSSSPKKPSTPVSRQLTNQSFVDESLHDEDAWMPILAVVNAELDVLNRLENEQNRLRTLM